MLKQSHDLKEDLMGTKFFIFVKYVVYDWGLGAHTHETPSSIYFNCDKSCSIDSDLAIRIGQIFLVIITLPSTDRGSIP